MTKVACTAGGSAPDGGTCSKLTPETVSQSVVSGTGAPAPSAISSTPPLSLKVIVEESFYMVKTAPVEVGAMICVAPVSAQSSLRWMKFPSSCTSTRLCVLSFPSMSW